MRCLSISLICLASFAQADPATIEAVEATHVGQVWRFSVTLSHPDTGWDHYADGWRVTTLDGEVLGTRELLHPHVNEQPFTRSLGNVSIPDDITAVLIQARDSADGWDENTVTLDLSDPTYAR
ncbi:hypothetical protein [Cognatishimia maritima]|uniref:Uncharacterized protein n=1 Tax=Cognatishimia maritima TaxID=870908 RepID=A0A1M5N4V4_9RHOB|nr:hypothetical protein [Cognatishimia maritima]SHG84023.1 hypothetical protein SAMN04488044_1409 [Cognatishimia maritima]